MTHKLINAVLLLMLPVLAACNLVSAQDATPTSQQPDTSDTQWFAYVYNNVHDTLLRVSADGSQTSYSLGLADSLSTSYELSFNEDGSRVAFCKRDYDNEAGIAAYTLIVRDVAAQTNLVEVDLGAGVSKICTLGHQAFANNRVAVAVMNYNVFDTNPDTSQPMWQITLMDATTGATISQIDSNNNPVQLDAQYQNFDVPLIVHSTGTEVILSFAPYGGEGPIELPAFLWNTDSGTVEAIAYWGLQGVSMLDTGEIAYPANDPALPAGTSVGPMPVFNVVQVFGRGAAHNIYQSAEWLISRAQFINNGQQIAVLEYASFNPDQPNDPIPPSRWIAIDRAGNVTELLTVQYQAEVQPAPDGYVVMEQTYPNGDFQQAPHFMLRLVSHDVSTTLLELDSADSSIWNLMWVMPTTTASNLTPFPTLNQ